VSGGKLRDLSSYHPAHPSTLTTLPLAQTEAVSVPKGRWSDRRTGEKSSAEASQERSSGHKKHTINLSHFTYRVPTSGIGHQCYWALEGGNNLLAYRIYPDIWSIFNKLNRDQGPTVGLGIREFVMAWRYEDRVVQYLLAVEGTDGIPSVVQRALKSKRRLKG